MAAGEYADLPLDAWGLRPLSVEPLRGGTANQNFLITTADERYVLRRRSPRYASPQQIAFDHALMRRLAEHGVTAPNPLPTSNGATTCERAGGVYELHCFFPGRPLRWEDEVELALAARELWHFHEATREFTPPAAKDWPREDRPEDILAGLAELRVVIDRRGERQILDTLERWAHRIAAELPDDRFWALPRQVVHGDFHSGNLLIRGETIGFFDLDCASYQPRARDVADGILYLCARRDGPFDATTIQRLTRECWLEPTRNRIFIESYGALTVPELEALPWLIAARWIYSRVRGRLKLPREQWPGYATDGILTPLRSIGEGAWI